MRSSRRFQGFHGCTEAWLSSPFLCFALPTARPQLSLSHSFHGHSEQAEPHPVEHRSAVGHTQWLAPTLVRANKGRSVSPLTANVSANFTTHVKPPVNFVLFLACNTTTLYNTVQQWVMPNGCPPLQHMLAEGAHLHAIFSTSNTEQFSSASPPAPPPPPQVLPPPCTTQGSSGTCPTAGPHCSTCWLKEHVCMVEAQGRSLHASWSALGSGKFVHTHAWVAGGPQLS